MSIDKAGWQYTKNIGEEYGQSPRPKAYDDVSLPRSAHKHYPNHSRRFEADMPPAITRPTASERDVDERPSPGYAQPFATRDEPPARSSPAITRQAPPASSTPTDHELPQYSKVNKNRSNPPPEEKEAKDEADSWV